MKKKPVLWLAGVAAVAGLSWFAYSRREKPPAATPEAPPPASSLHGVPQGGSLLDQMGVPQGSVPASASAKDNAALEKDFEWLVSSKEHLSDLKSQVAEGLAKHEKPAAEIAEGRQLVSEMNTRLSAMEGDLAAARKDRPDDPVVQWLTGELLMFVGGEPNEILPYFHRAVDAGLKRPRALASLSIAEFGADDFDNAYAAAKQAVDGDPKSRYVWDAYTQAAFGVQKFSEVARLLARHFPANSPGWTATARQNAEKLGKEWQREQALRQAEARAGNLPVVRMAIQHRRFAQTPDGRATTDVEASSPQEVEFELFRNDAPETVANFLKLVESGFYNGTLFHLVESGLLVGGDPNTRNGNPQDDGSGGPGYTIGNEFRSPGARNIFRGSLCMVNTGPNTAGSQFFVTMVPRPEFNGHFTVFGRVIRGQEALDHMTPGRTNLHVGHFGKVIPGDLLVHAEVRRGHSPS